MLCIPNVNELGGQEEMCFYVLDDKCHDQSKNANKFDWVSGHSDYKPLGMQLGVHTTCV